MKLTLTIPDDLYETYSAMPGAKGSVEEVIVGQLARFSSCNYRERFLVVDPQTRLTLEKLLAAHLLTSAHLLERVQKLASVEIGNLRLSPSPGQLLELAARAKRNGRTPEQEAEFTFRRIGEAFFATPYGQ